MRHVIGVLVENKFGVLSRVAGLFSARGYNIDSLSVGSTDDPSMSRMTIVVKGNDKVLEQVVKQLNKLIDVIKVLELTRDEHVERELVMVSVRVGGSTAKKEALNMAAAAGARVIKAKQGVVLLERVGTTDEIASFLELLKPFSAKEVVRTGKIAIGV